MNNIDRFRNLYKKFEDETKKKLNYKYDKVWECIDILVNKRWQPYFNERGFIEFCNRLRNMDSHNNNDNYYLITDETIKKLEEILYVVEHPYKVSNKATSNVYSKTISDLVLPTMQEMNEKCYTHIPIYEDDNKTLTGIFSENSLFQYVMEDHLIEVDEKTTFNDIKKCIDLTRTKEIVKFVSRNAFYDEVVNDFIKEFKEGNKLACVMITQNGKNTEKVIGIITSWDIIGRY